MDGGGQARIQRERRFLLPSLPRALAHGVAAMIEERYIAGTGLTLRRTLTPGGRSAGFGPPLTLSQRVRAGSQRSERIVLTDRLTADQYAALARLPAQVLVWRRYLVELTGHQCGLDVFSGELKGLVLAEATFLAAEQSRAFPRPTYAVAEVTGDDRFSAWALVHTSAGQLAILVAEYGMLLR
ncbi:MAG TPA: hypothetical protein VMU51_23630 [Mycobacteriales bacterium]|nr:hypothetical protein [Mycobacteriales bacterium]